ncbi:unnamed protein product [Phytomonas sp. Hart1]|nr:unnamed protein product [Phytomonas sp. Hart1]|eukprot:CCW71019.1 unnamed protein product [Phytomonas sp. isolate Hart1]
MYSFEFVSLFALIAVALSMSAIVSATNLPNCTFFTGSWQRDSIHWSLTTPPKDTHRMQIAELYTPKEGSKPFYIALRLKLRKGLHHHFGTFSTSRPLFALCPLSIECPSETSKDLISLFDQGKLIRIFSSTTNKLQLLYGCYSQNHYKVYRRIYEFTGQVLLPVSFNDTSVLLQAHAREMDCVAIASSDDSNSALMLIQTLRSSKMVRISQKGITTEVDVQSLVLFGGPEKRFEAKHLCYNSHNGLAVGSLIWQDTFKGIAVLQLFKLNDGVFPTTTLFYELDTTSYADSDASLVSSCGSVQRLSFEGCRLIPIFDDDDAPLAIEIDVSVHTPAAGGPTSASGTTWQYCRGASYRAVISLQKHARADPKGGDDVVEVSSFEKIKTPRKEMHASDEGIGATEWVNVHQPFASTLESFSSTPLGLRKLSKSCRDHMTRWWELPNNLTTWCCVHLSFTYLDACYLYTGILFFVLGYKVLNLFYFSY